MTVPTPTRPDFRQHLLVETPEHVTIDYEIAGLGSRALAAMADHLLLSLWTLAVMLGTSYLGLLSRSFATLVYVVVIFLSLWGYFALLEGLRRGQTPGKRWLGIRVVMDTGHPVTLPAALLRNLLRVADFAPFGYFLGGVFVGFHPRGKRLGDLVAGTVVVRDRPHEARPAATARPVEYLAVGAPRLADAEFRLLAGFRARAAEMSLGPRQRLSAALFERFGARFPELGGTADEILEQIFDDETARRAGARTGLAAGLDSAARLVERQRPRWTR